MQNFRVLASILTDIFHFLLEKGREKESKLVSKLRDQYVELPIFQREKAELKKNTNCRTRNFCYSNCKFVVGIIIVSPTLLSLLATTTPHVKFCTDQQKKINYSAPIRDIELKLWG